MISSFYNFWTARLSTSVLLVILVAVPTSALSQNSRANKAALFNAINDRLSLMEDVALYKNQENAAVEDLAREEIVLAQSQSAAGELGLNTESIQEFFKAQIAVAKAIQHRHLADWQSTPAGREPIDLQSELRPALSELGDQIIQLIAVLVHADSKIVETDRSVFTDTISVRHVSNADKELLFNSLLRIQ